MNYNMDANYALSRLNSSWVATEQGFLYVRRVFVEANHLFVSGSLPNSLEEPTLPIEECDLSVGNIGYVQGGWHSTFIYRVPVRQYRQGMRPGRNTFKDGSPLMKGSRYRRDFQVSSNIWQAYKGEYPDFSFCVDKVLNEEAGSMCFHKFWAVGRQDNTLFGLYKNKVVGAFNPHMELNLANKYILLRESWERLKK